MSGASDPPHALPSLRPSNSPASTSPLELKAEHAKSRAPVGDDSGRLSPSVVSPRSGRSEFFRSRSGRRQTEPASVQVAANDMSTAQSAVFERLDSLISDFAPLAGGEEHASNPAAAAERSRVLGRTTFPTRPASADSLTCVAQWLGRKRGRGVATPPANGSGGEHCSDVAPPSHSAREPASTSQRSRASRLHDNLGHSLNATVHRLSFAMKQHNSLDMLFLIGRFWRKTFLFFYWTFLLVTFSFEVFYVTSLHRSERLPGWWVQLGIRGLLLLCATILGVALVIGKGCMRTRMSQSTSFRTGMVWLSEPFNPLVSALFFIHFFIVLLSRERLALFIYHSRGQGSHTHGFGTSLEERAVDQDSRSIFVCVVLVFAAVHTFQLELALVAAMCGWLVSCFVALYSATIILAAQDIPYWSASFARDLIILLVSNVFAIVSSLQARHLKVLLESHVKETNKQQLEHASERESLYARMRYLMAQLMHCEAPRSKALLTRLETVVATLERVRDGMVEVRRQHLLGVDSSDVHSEFRRRNKKSATVSHFKKDVRRQVEQITRDARSLSGTPVALWEALNWAIAELRGGESLFSVDVPAELRRTSPALTKSSNMINFLSEYTREEKPGSDGHQTSISRKRMRTFSSPTDPQFLSERQMRPHFRLTDVPADSESSEHDESATDQHLRPLGNNADGKHIDDQKKYSYPVYKSEAEVYTLFLRSFTHTCEASLAQPGQNKGAAVATEEPKREGQWTRFNVLLPISSLDLSSAGTWNCNIFRLFADAQGRPLQALTYALLRPIAIRENLPLEKLSSFMRNIEQRYRANSYHNMLHGADVMNSAYTLLATLAEGCDPQTLATRPEGITHAITECEVTAGAKSQGGWCRKEDNGNDDNVALISRSTALATLLSAAAHDVGHNGRSNRFHVNARTGIAILYNDQAVLENMHAAIAFALLSTEGTDVLSRYGPEEQARLRHLMIENILETDLSRHFQALASAKVAAQKGFDLSSPSTLRLLMSLIIKASDIGHSSKMLELHRQWTFRCLHEFFDQGDEEKRLHIAVSPYCDRDSCNIPESQVGFLNFIVEPFYDFLFETLPLERMREVCLVQLKANKNYWEREFSEKTDWPVELEIPLHPWTTTASTYRAVAESPYTSGGMAVREASRRSDPSRTVKREKIIGSRQSFEAGRDVIAYTKRRHRTRHTTSPVVTNASGSRPTYHRRHTDVGGAIPPLPVADSPPRRGFFGVFHIPGIG